MLEYLLGFAHFGYELVLSPAPSFLALLESSDKSAYRISIIFLLHTELISQVGQLSIALVVCNLHLLFMGQSQVLYLAAFALLQLGHIVSECLHMLFALLDEQPQFLQTHLELFPPFLQ